MLQAGQPAPDFSLPDADMITVGLGQFKGRKNVVLFFYPKDGTPGGTMEAVDFSDHEADFAAHDAVVIGVSGDDCLRHAEFRDANGVSVTLLADIDLEACRLYGVVQDRENNGVHATTIARATFVIDKRGKIRHVLHGFKPRGHAAEVLALVKAL